jgi:C1A family cysteine protease
METMVRIQHGMWSKRSEADMHDQMGVSCAQTGGPDFALNWAANNGGGVADKQCDEYHMDDQPYFPCGDRSGRTLRVPEYTTIGTVEDQKQWLVNVGPIAACFNVYEDFYTWNWSEGPYKYDGKSKLAGGHCILIVGYDDKAGCWIMRNSWGTGFGVNGYGNLT